MARAKMSGERFLAFYDNYPSTSIIVDGAAGYRIISAGERIRVERKDNFFE